MKAVVMTAPGGTSVQEREMDGLYWMALSARSAIPDSAS
jgi:hypothetical protein